MSGYYCTRCHQRMKRNAWGWFCHVLRVTCEGQNAYWADEE